MLKKDEKVIENSIGKKKTILLEDKTITKRTKTTTNLKELPKRII